MAGGGAGVEARGGSRTIPPSRWVHLLLKTFSACDCFYSYVVRVPGLVLFPFERLAGWLTRESGFAGGWPGKRVLLEEMRSPLIAFFSLHWAGNKDIDW